MWNDILISSNSRSTLGYLVILSSSVSLVLSVVGLLEGEKQTSNWRMRNHTETIEFILLGLSDDPQFQAVIFVFLLITYMLSITGNLTIITLTLLDAHLQTPMYFFLRNFSILEISFTTVSIPKFLATIITGDKTNSFNDCIAQFCFCFCFCFHSLGSHWVLPSGCHVLWLLHCHLQTPALHDHHESQSLHTACLLFLASFILNHIPCTHVALKPWLL